MALFQVTKKVHEIYPYLNFYGVKVENLKVTQKLLYIKARKKRILRDFREMYTFENLKEAPQVKVEAKVEEKVEESKEEESKEEEKEEAAEETVAEEETEKKEEGLF